METITTNIGYSNFKDDHIYFGYKILDQLLGKVTYLDLICLALRIDKLSEQRREILDHVSTVLSAADPRIWPLKITRLIASYGSPLVGYAAGHLCLETKLLGPWSIGTSAKLLQDFDEKLGHDIDNYQSVLRELNLYLNIHKKLQGFGVPFRAFDERLNALSLYVKSKNLDKGKYWQLFESISLVAKEQKKLVSNVGLGVAALFLDSGFEPTQIGLLSTILMGNTILANAYEGAMQASGPAGELLRKLPDECVEYIGPPPRKSPRALEAEAKAAAEAEAKAEADARMPTTAAKLVYNDNARAGMPAEAYDEEEHARRVAVYQHPAFR